MTTLRKIEGIGDLYARKLWSAGLHTQEELLRHCGERRGRKLIADRSGISEGLLLDWVNRADLERIHGVGEEYSDLLEHCGVDTVPELALRNPEQLYLRMTETNEKRHFVRRLPTLEDTKHWINEAKTLPKQVYH